MGTLKGEYRSLSIMEIIPYLINFLLGSHLNPSFISHIPNIAHFFKAQFNHQLWHAILDFPRKRRNLPLNFFNTSFSSIFKYNTTSTHYNVCHFILDFKFLDPKICLIYIGKLYLQGI